MGVRLDNIIADHRYILECLVLLRKIQESGNCHTCSNNECNCRPELGEMIRYNCPNYIKKMVETQESEKYCDRNICMSNEYNGIGCDECEVTKSQESVVDNYGCYT